jgi:hypothetical protein
MYSITYTTDPSPIVLGQLFTIDAVVTDAHSGEPIQTGTVAINARMPQHGHGMPTKPEDDPGVCGSGACSHPAGHYLTRGMKFHMAGDWMIRFDVTGPGGIDHLEVPYRL